MGLGIGIRLDLVRGGGAPAAIILGVYDFTGLALGKVAGGLTSAFPNLTHTRASAATVQTGDTTVDTSLGANDCGVGSLGAGWQGLVVEEARTNYGWYSTDWSQFSGGVTGTQNAAVAPDGTTTAALGTCTNTGQQWKSVNVDAIPGGVHGCLSWWTKSGSMTSATWDLYPDNSNNGCVATGTFDTGPAKWRRFRSPAVFPTYGSQGGSSSGHQVMPLQIPGSTGTLYGWGYQVEVGSFPTELIVSAGAGATRAGARLYVNDVAKLVPSSGRLRVQLAVRPKGDVGVYADINGATVRQQILYRDASNQAWFDGATGQFFLVVAGTTYQGGIPYWHATDPVTILIETGGGVPTIVTVTAGDGIPQAIVASNFTTGNWPTTGTLDLLCNGTTLQFSAWVQSVTFYGVEQAPPALAPLIDSNTLVSSDLYSSAWSGGGIISSASSVETVWRAQPDPSGAGTQCNPLQDAPATEYKGQWFHTPAGTSGLTASVTLKLDPRDVASTAILQILNGNGTVRGATSCVLSSTPTQFTCTVSASPDTEYMVQLLLNNAGAGTSRQARALMTVPVAVTAAGATGIFAASYKRIAVDRRSVRDSVRNVFTNYGLGTKLSPMSRVKLDTNGAVAIDYWSTMVPAGYTATQGAGEIFVDGAPAQILSAPATLTGAVQVYTPSAGSHSLEVVAGPQQTHLTTTPWDPESTPTRAIYVPTASTTVVHPEVLTGADRCLLILGDSICGLSANQPSIGGWPQLIRWGLQAVDQYPGRVVNDTLGSGTLTIQAGLTQATASAMVARWAWCNPTDIWIEMGSNDAKIGQSATTFGTIYGHVLDAIRAQFPSAKVRCQTPIYRVGYEPTPMGDFRTAILTAVSTRTAWCTSEDGLAIMSYPSDYQGDGTHPTDAAMPKYGTAVATDVGF